MSIGRHDMTDREWRLIEPLLPRGRPGPRRRDDRQVIGGILWVLRSGAPWRDLPPSYGPYMTCYNRFNRWSKAGIWRRIMEALQGDDGDGSGGGGVRRSGEMASGARVIDTSIVRVHKHGSGARRDQGPQDIGRSRGGLTTKLHVLVDDCGGPRSLHLTPGQRADSAEALRLLEDIEAGMTVVADKAYDTNAILARIADAGATAAIPAKSTRKTPRPLDAAAYARRNVVERLFARIKEFRRAATRYEKLSRNFLSAICLIVSACILRARCRGTALIEYRA